MVTADGENVWEETSTYLRRGKGDESASSGSVFPDAEPTGIVWKLPGDLGRRYAAVSGDHNPIHLYPITAKALGFPRQIAHGMWTMARCVAALENRLPGLGPRRRGVQEAGAAARARWRSARPRSTAATRSR